MICLTVLAQSHEFDLRMPQAHKLTIPALRCLPQGDIPLKPPQGLYVAGEGETQGKISLSWNFQKSGLVVILGIGVGDGALISSCSGKREVDRLPAGHSGNQAHLSWRESCCMDVGCDWCRSHLLGEGKWGREKYRRIPKCEGD